MSSDTNLISIRRTFNELATASKTLPIGVKQKQEGEGEREGKREKEREREKVRQRDGTTGRLGRQRE